MKLVFVAGIGIAVFIEFLLISKKNKSASDQILTLWMFLILVHLFLFYIGITENIYDIPFLLGIEQPLPLLHGVFLYLYVGSLTDQLPENRKILLLHFLPAGLMYAYLLTFFVLPADQKIQIYRNRGAGYELFNALRSYATSLSGILYVIWSAVLLRRHRNRIRDRFSDLEKVNLQWLLTLTLGLGGIWLLVVFTRSDTLVFSGVVVFVFLIGFFGVRQAAIFTPDQLPASGRLTTPEEPPTPSQAPTLEQLPTLNQAPTPERIPDLNQALTPDQLSAPDQAADGDEQREKYSKSGLKEEISGKLHQTLIQLMTENALYKKSDLSINDLSSKLGVHPNYLSQVINQKEKKNFYDFVNTYRIEEFKRLIAMPRYQQYTLLSLAYDCGFSSKSSFNRYFKKATGQTPSEYSTTLPRNQVTSS